MHWQIFNKTLVIMGTYNELRIKVLTEIDDVLSSVDVNKLHEMVDVITANKELKVLGYAAGRMGSGLKAFVMRLNHLGIKASFFGDNYVPPMNSNDVFICCSNSGTTKSVVNILEIFKAKSGGKVISFVGNENSKMAELSDIVVKFKTCNGGLNSADDPSKINSIQPMTTLTEQAMFILFDLIVMMIIDKLGIDIKDTKQYHSNIE
jgi:6-phospho-3-hexuloisomerase